MSLIRIALVCAVVLVVLTVAVVLLYPHSRAAAKGYLDSAWDCYHGERLLKFSVYELPKYVERYPFPLHREGIEYEQHGCLRSSPCASYNRAYTRMTQYALSRDFGYDILGELEGLPQRGGVTVRITH